MANPPRAVRMTAKEWQQVADRATAEGMTPSQLVRKAVKAYLGDALYPSPDPKTPTPKPKSTPRSDISEKPAPTAPEKAPKPAQESPKSAISDLPALGDKPESGEIDWQERQRRFSKPAQAGRGHKK